MKAQSAQYIDILSHSDKCSTRNSLVPRPLPDFISQPWRKIGRRPGIKTMQNYVTDRKWWTRLVRNVDSVCTN